MNVFDIIGPVMIGPSSSHTAGAARLGRIARALLGQRPVRADILLHGSFAKTYRGHGTDKAIVAGVLGMAPDDARIRESLALAQMTGLAVSITPGECIQERGIKPAERAVHPQRCRPQGVPCS